jgi:hypothetical protein
MTGTSLKKRDSASTIALALSCGLVNGCGRAPSFNVLGSYFPAWLLCITMGIAAASVTASLLSRFEKQSLIRWTIVVYPSLAASIAFTLWLAFFS